MKFIEFVTKEKFKYLIVTKDYRYSIEIGKFRKKIR